MSDLERDLRALPGLLARTASDSEEEARTCALQACRIIREHGLVLALPGPDERAAKNRDRVAGWAAGRKAREKRISVDPELVREGIDVAGRVVDLWHKAKKVIA